MDDHDTFEPADSSLIFLENNSPLDAPLPTENYRQFIDVPVLASDSNKRYSLDHDIKMGWVPRTQIAGPIPLTFENGPADATIENTLQNCPNNVIYLGWRPSNTFEVHQKHCANNSKYPFYQFHLCKSTFLSNFIRKYYPDYNFSKRRPFSGMNPTLSEQQLIFDSDYEGGNLDAVILQRKDYELYIRIDSNTRGHCNYYCFKVRNKNIGSHRFTLANLSSKRTLYERGMRPFAKSHRNLKRHWEQVGTNIRYSTRELKNKPNEQGIETTTQVNCLSFDYEFKTPDDEVQFCYCIPYTYSDMLKDISDLQTNQQKKHIIHRSRLSFTLSGVQIPVLTITNRSPDQSKKLCIVVSGRIHPGQSNSSFVMLGLLRYLTSPAAAQLRDSVIFKIIPMLNPDGVILGNHRTSVSGKDLNREFLSTNKVIFPEVIALKEYTTQLKQRFGDRLIAFFDIHGHSMRKNAFVYGPEYPIFELGYMRSRVLPRLIASKTSMFRYYSCRFINDLDKERTARAVFFSTLKIELAYTLESSNYCFFNAETREHTNFNEKNWAKLGRILGESLADLIEIQTSRESIRDKMASSDLKDKKSGKQGKKGDLEAYKKLIETKFSKEEMDFDQPKSNKKSKNINRSEKSFREAGSANFERNSTLEEQKQSQIQSSRRRIKKQEGEQHPIEGWENGDQSDRYSQEGADSQPEDHDLPKNELKAFHGRIRQNKKNYFQQISKFKGDEQEVKKVKIRRHSNLDGNFHSTAYNERLSQKLSAVIPPRIKPQSRTLNQPKKATIKKQSQSLKNVKVQPPNQLPSTEQFTYYRQEPKKQRQTIRNQDYKQREYIRIDQQTLQRLIQNSKFSLLQTKPEPTARVEQFNRHEKTQAIQNNILRRKKSIKALHTKARDRNIYRALETVFSNTKSLPRIVILKN